MAESLLIGLIVLLAAGYAVWALLPVSTRRRLALRGAHGLGGAGAPGVAGKVARVLQKIASAPAGGCSDCPAATLTPAEREKPPRPE
jgi:hypothetical protein